MTGQGPTAGRNQGRNSDSKSQYTDPEIDLVVPMPASQPTKRKADLQTSFFFLLTFNVCSHAASFLGDRNWR